MTPGIYYVTFSAMQTQNVGEGLAVFKDGKVNGGDPGYLYRGSYSISGETVTAELHITRWNPALRSVLGSFTDYHLNLTGKIAPDFANFSVEGAMKEQQQIRITIKGRRLSDAV